MLNRFFGQKAKEEARNTPPPTPEPTQEAGTEAPVAEQGFNPFKKSLSRTRQFFTRFGGQSEGVVSEASSVHAGSPAPYVEPVKPIPITDDMWDDLEEALLLADVGPHTSDWLMTRLRERVAEEAMRTTQQVQKALREEMVTLLQAAPLRFAKQSPLTVILVIGVNGSGKTTSIGKMARRLTDEGHRVTLAAADTFRAAAIDQLKVWGERVGVPVISQGPGSDPGAVVYDAIQAANTRGSDVLIVDTAGRLHTKYNLMEELKKINKVVEKLLPEGRQELLMVIDATTGQNALLQARKFAADIGLTGVIITKLDSTAKGGFAFAVADDLGVPIKFVGTGEKIEDLTPFDPQSFVAALFAQD
ncbi:MAG TPA: signal recognition particle-docking protein FtsY [Ktedonobacteraceae bacterium]|nr:signal recognition particle-docking protein FtsY [Ktedonobacteraceae bacterium]